MMELVLNLIVTLRNSPWTLVVVTLTGGIFFFMRGFVKLRIRRRIRGLATSRIKSMAMGTVEVSGVALCDTPLLDPIFLKSCVYFHITVKEQRGSGKHRHWVTVYEKKSPGTPFYIQDETGRVLVIPDSPDVYLGTRISRSSSFFHGLSDDADLPGRFMRSKRSGTLNLTADIIHEGDPLFVLGVAHPLPNEMRVGAGVSLREAAEKLKKDKERMKQIDVNADGQIDGMEWETAVANFKKELDSEAAAMAKNTPNKVDLFTSTAFVSKGSGSGLVIANDENDLVSKLGRYAFLEVFGGGGSIVFGVARALMLFAS